MKKRYFPSQWGRRIRFHVTKRPSRRLIDAIDFVVDQRSWRYDEHKLNTKEGNTKLITDSALDLNTKEMIDYVREIKARRYGPDWSLFYQSLSKRHPRIAKIVSQKMNWNKNEAEIKRILIRGW